MTKNAVLIIVDIQNDFCPGGALPVKNGNEIIPLVNKLSYQFNHVIATQDWHSFNQISFASNYEGKNAYDTVEIDGIKQTLWPNHCVQGTTGADFHHNLILDNIDLILRKGTHDNIDSYSAFLENDKKTITGLHGYLKALDIKKVYLCGLATDYCVFYSALDAIKLGFETYVILDACRGINIPENNIENSIKTMKKQNIKIINSSDLM